MLKVVTEMLNLTESKCEDLVSETASLYCTYNGQIKTNVILIELKVLCYKSSEGGQGIFSQ